MRHDVLMDMSLSELDEYGKVCGIDVTGRKGKAAKVALIEERQGRVAEVDVLGVTLSIPKRRLHDKRIADMLQGHMLTDDETARAFVDLLGEEQHALVLARCTDEDGIVDVDAYGLAFAKVMTNAELKKY